MASAADLCEMIDRLSREHTGHPALQTSYELYKAAVQARLVEAGPEGQGRVAMWFGQLVDDGRASYSGRSPDKAEIPRGVWWSTADLEAHSGYTLTNGGRDDAREHRRYRRERVTDALLSGAFGEDSLSGLEEAARAALAGHVRDVRSALDAADAPRAIGAAKELVESAAKIVLEAAGESVPGRANPGQLYRSALAAIGRSEPAERGFTVARGAVSLVAGVAELRNAVGVAHGASTPRHASMADARLAAGAALAACRFLLEQRCAFGEAEA